MTVSEHAAGEVRLTLEDVETQTVNAYGVTEPLATYETIARSDWLVDELGDVLGQAVVLTGPPRLSEQRGFGGHEILEAAKEIAFALQNAAPLEGAFGVIGRWLSLGNRRNASLRWSTADGAEMQLDLSGYTEEGAIAFVTRLLESGVQPTKMATAATHGRTAEPADWQPNWDIYLSHARKDGATSARELHDHLHRLKPDATVFLDVVVLPLGLDWDRRMEKALEASRLIAVLITAGSVDAYYQREEVRIAIDRGRKDSSVRVVPISLDGTGVTLFGLGLKQGLDVKEAGGLEAVAIELLRVGHPGNAL